MGSYHHGAGYTFRCYLSGLGETPGFGINNSNLAE